ncbi:MAG TPA: hypothetical protein VJ183_08390 [Chloroflexia bacterium]|nr:hypothetical protein [Chloroflexia bacterium]
MSRQRKPQASLDELLVGRLPDRVIDRFKEIEFTVDEVLEWEKSKPPGGVVFRPPYIIIDIHIRTTTKKALGVIGAVGSIIWIALQFLLPYIQSIQPHLNGP